MWKYYADVSIIIDMQMCLLEQGCGSIMQDYIDVSIEQGSIPLHYD